MPPAMSPPMQESSQNRKSRRKMKCLISIGLILPALAAVIGVAAWAVSADVVMNSGSRVKTNNNNNQLLQANDQGQDRGDVFRNNQPPSQGEDNQRRPNMQGRPSDSQQIPPSPKRRTTPSTPSPPSATDVSAILSKLISASGAASGGNGPRFVVVAPLPDHGKVVDEEEPQEAERPSSVARVDNSNIRYADHSSRQQNRHVASGGSFRGSSYNQQYGDSSSGNHDLMASASSQHYQQVQPYHGSSNNVSSRVGLSSSQTNPRRSGEQPFVINLSSNNHRRDFNSQPLDMAGFEPFLSPQTLLGTSSNHQQGPPPPPPGYMASGPFTANSKKRPQPQNYFPQHHGPPPQQQPKPGPPNMHGGFEQSHPSHFNPLPSNGGSNSGFGLKPIQKHLHHHDVPPHPHPSSIKDGNNNPHGPPPRADESNRWGTIGFHGGPPGGFAPEPPKGISLSISSPSAEYGHKEPVSVIKSFFLPFLPKPRVNLNARVVFGVVLDKGLGLGGKKEGGHHHHPVY